MKTANKTAIRSSIVAIAMAMPSLAYSAAFIDTFSSDTSANYTGTQTSGGGTANGFTISGGTLNIDPNGRNSYTVFNNTAVFDIGDTLSVDTTTSAGHDIRLSVSTSAVGPNTGTNNGVRLKRNRGDGSFEFQAYSGTGAVYDSAFNISAGSAITLFLTRESADTFSAAYDAGSGLVQLNTSGGTEKQIISVTGVPSSTLFIGVEGYGDSASEGAVSFDNLQVVIPEPSTMALLGLGGLALLRRRRA